MLKPGNRIWGTVLLAVMITAGGIADSYAAPGDMVWMYATGGAVASSAAVGSDGTIYFGSYDNALYALNPGGTLKWKYQTGGRIYSSPFIATDGTVYVGSDDKSLYALRPEGTLVWQYVTGGTVSSSPAAGPDGTVYAGCDDNILYALNPDGTLKWQYGTGGAVASSPAVGSDGTVYVGSRDKKLYAVSPEGNYKWAYTTGGQIVSSPAVAADGTVYVGSWDKNLYAINADGTLRWKYATGGWIASSPVIGSDGTVYIGSWDHFIYAVNPQGTLRWRYDTGNAVWASPGMGPDGMLYTGTWNDTFYALNSDGNLRWKYQTGNEIWSTAAVGSDGTVYAGSFDKNFYAFEGNASWGYAAYAVATEAYSDSPKPGFGFGLHKKLESLSPSLKLGGIQVYSSETASVPLTLDNPDSVPIELIDITVTFDKELLELSEVTLAGGMLEGGKYKISDQKGEASVSIQITAEENLFRSSGDIAYLKFKGIGKAGDKSVLSFTKRKINHAFVKTADGSLEIIAEPTAAAPSLTLPATTRTFPNETISLPLTLNNSGSARIEGIDAEITFDKTVLKISDVSLTGTELENSSYRVDFKAEDGKVSLEIYTLNEIFRGTGVIAYLTFDVIGKTGSKSDVTFTAARNNESDITATKGSVEVINPVFKISGRIGYYSSPESKPVRNVTIALEGERNQSFITKTDGTYLFSDVYIGDYSSAPSKTDDLGGLSATDASKIARYAEGLIELDAYQKIAADVTLNGEISGTDASNISRYAAGLTDSLNTAGTDWTFVPVAGDGSLSSDRTYSPLNSDKENENFVAIRLGDVTGDWQASTPKKRKTSESAVRCSVTADTGAMLTVPLVLKQNAAVEGIDVTITFDENVLECVDLSLDKGILEDKGYVLVSKKGEGEIRLLIFAAQDIFTGSGEIAMLSFKSISGKTTELTMTQFDCNESPASGSLGPVER